MNTSPSFIHLIPNWLQHSKSYYASLVAPDRTYLWMNGLFNDKFCESGKTLIGVNYEGTVHEDDIPKCSEIARMCFQFPEETFTIKIRKPDLENGGYFWTIWDFSSLVDRQGNIKGILCIGHDLSEEERTNKEISYKIDSIIDQITDGFYVIDNNFKVLKINRAAEQLLSVQRGEALGCDYLDFLGKTEDDICYQFYLKAFDTEETQRFEYFDLGLCKWIRKTVYPSHEGLTVFFRDITTEKENQQRLIDSENKLSAILDSSADNNILVSPDYHILSFNRTVYNCMLKNAGLSLKTGELIWDYLHPEIKDDFIREFKHALAGEKITFEREIMSTTKREWFEIRFYPAYDRQGDLIGVTFSTTNINYRKQTENKLKEIDLIQRAIYNSSIDGKTFMNLSGEIVFFNKTAAEWVEQVFNQKLNVGARYTACLNEEFAQHYDLALLAQGKYIRFEFEAKNEWYLITVFPVYDDQQQLIGFADNVRNISLKKAHELKISHQNDYLKRIAWQQSHQVRRPLSNILGLINLIRLEHPDYIDNEYVKKLENASYELDEIIRKISQEVTDSQR
jgi:PAS domain S-box-containing protein